MTVALFLEMLSFKRPAFSVYEEAFIDRYLRKIPGITEDGYGNLLLDIGDKPNIIWSSHTDTVHTTSGLQDVFVDKKSIVRVRDQKTSNCLGADCTTGVYIMMEMIKARVPGRYIFHRDEEAGRQGSQWIVDKTPDVLKGIDAAIAFDRRGFSDIITHQSYRTSSNEFAESLAKILDMDYKPSPNGSFTDTRSYMALVPECTNISVGYGNAHSSAECQDLPHLIRLVEAMKKFDSSSLVIKRTAAEPEAQTYHWQGGARGYYGGSSYSPPSDVYGLVRENPKSVATIMEMVGWDFETLSAMIKVVQLNKSEDLDESFLPDFITKGNLPAKAGVS